LVRDKYYHIKSKKVKEKLKKERALELSKLNPSVAFLQQLHAFLFTLCHDFAWPK
jgi:hypothetical protein